MSHDKRRLVEISRYLSYVLRHNPKALSLTLDDRGWTDFATLCERLQDEYADASTSLVQQIVADDPKGRYELKDGRIRACQGHSVAVDPTGNAQEIPPDSLYHGTNARAWESIQSSGGLQKMQRHHVHLSPDQDTAQRVGRRHGPDVIILQIDAKAMASEGFVFFRSANGVWLTDTVPLRFLSPQSAIVRR